MKKIITILLVLLVFVQCNTEKKESMKYPETRRDTSVFDDYFGTKVADPYRWLEDDNSEETKAWVIEQNKVTDAYLAKIPFKSKIKERLEKVWNYEKRSAPSKKGEIYFYYKNDGLQNQYVLYKTADLTSDGEVFLDPNKLSEDGTVALGSTAFSEDGKYMAYTIARGGSDWNEIYVRDVATGKDLEDHVEWVKFSGISWNKESTGFYYSRYDAPKKGGELSNVNEFHKVYYHQVGTPANKDVLVFEDKKNPKQNCYGSVTEDGKYLIIGKTQSTHGNAWSVKDLTKKNAPLVDVVKEFDNEYNVVYSQGDILYVLTNADAPKYRLIKIDLKNPAKENWTDVIAESDAVLEGIDAANGNFIVNYLKDVHSEISVYNYEGKKINDIKLPDIGAVTGISAKNDQTEIFYTFTSYTMPARIYKYDMAANKSEIYFEPKVDFNPEDYETKQVFYPSKDGTKIPMFIVMKKGTKLDGNNPTLMYGYGGFNVIYKPGFNVSRIPWLENGGVFVNAHIRGGGEYGEEWHKAGTVLNKQNVFDDFIAGAEYLMENKYTNPDKMAILGGSNGGLLVAAVVNQRPDLFRVAFPAVGVLDMLRFHKFTIGWAWVGDYGSSDNEEQFKYIYNYSPLHNIKENAEYPAIMVTTADHDDRVVPAHSFKYIAELQHKYKGTNPVIVRIESNAGHSAGKPTSKQIEESTDMWSFTFFNMGIEPYK
jgi:prolyl oligopeptidase